MFAARKVKGLTEKETADVIKISEKEYNELEYNLKTISADMAKRFEVFYDIPADYFMIPSAVDIQELVTVLEAHKSMLSTPGLEQVTAGTHIAVARMGIDLVIAEQNIRALLVEQVGLRRENKALRELYNSVRENSNK